MANECFRNKLESLDAISLQYLSILSKIFKLLSVFLGIEMEIEESFSFDKNFSTIV